VESESEPLAYREEVRGIFFTINDMNANIRAIRQLLEEEFGGEEEAPEDDA